MIEPLIDSTENPMRKPATPSAAAGTNKTYFDGEHNEALPDGNEWIADFAGQWDFCVVMPLENGEWTNRGLGYIDNLTKLGYELFAYKGKRDQTEGYILLRTPIEKLRAFADNIDMSLLLDSEEVAKQLAAGDPENNIGPAEIAHVPEVTKYFPYEYIYGKYSKSIDEKLYWRENGAETPFRELIRLKLCALILESRPPRREPDGRIVPGENLKIRRYLRNGWMKGVFPLHDRVKTELIDFKMKFYPKQSLPLDDMKEYFGEKIGLYFGFTEHYTRWLLAPAIIGFPLQIAVFALNDYDLAVLPFYSIFIALWAVFMLEFWKRKEKYIALKWGTLGFEETEVDRPDFKGEFIKSFIDGSNIRYFPSRQRNLLLAQSFMGIITLILLVTGVVVSIYVIRYAIAGDVGDSNAQTIASIANAVQIQIVNYLYSLLANALSERENHRTNTEYEDSMITKIFLFQFVNSYASFFYLAFVAENLGDCPENGCMSLLAINLAIIFGSRLLTGNLLELLLPYLSYQYKYRTQILVHGDALSRPEKEYMLDPYDGISSSLEDYAEVAIQFGYMSLFVTALPIAGLFACFSSLVEIKGDTWKLTNLHQRPFPKGAEDIGMWQTIFLMIAVIAVITNAALTVFTMTVIDSWSLAWRFWVFILFQWICFVLQAFIMAIIPDIPEEIDIQLQRTEFITRKLIDKVADEDDEDLFKDGGTLAFQEYPLKGGKFTQNTHLITGSMK